MVKFGFEKRRKSEYLFCVDPMLGKESVLVLV